MKRICFLKIRFIILLGLWCCCTAQQCTGTISDACGSYTTKPNVVRITLSVEMSTVPLNVPFPVIQNTGSLNNAINIQGSLYSPNPKSTMFGLKSETYAQCNGAPRFSNSCCITKSSNGCYSSGQENINQLSMIYQGAFKSKITVRAIVDNHESNSFLAGSFLYQGDFSIDATAGIPPTEVVCVLKYIKEIPFFDSPKPIEFCNFNQ